MSRREANWVTFARTLRWLRGTPFGSPEEPEVKRRMASSLSRRVWRPRRVMRREAGRSFVRRAHFTMSFLSSGMVRSMKMRSLLGGHGKAETLRTKGSAVMKRSTSAWRMEERMALWEAVKLRLTGIFPAKRTARLAIMPPLPGGRTMATLGLSVSLRMWRERAMATGRILENGRTTSSEPSTSLSPGCFFNPLRSAAGSEPLRMVREE